MPDAVLRVLTWDDPRGLDPLVAAAEAFVKTDAGRGVQVRCDVESLEDFESAGLEALTRSYDVLNIDHPHLGTAVRSGCLTPFDDRPAPCIGPSIESYVLDGRLWAIPVDAACQCAAARTDRVAALPIHDAQVFELTRRGRVVAASLAGVHSLMALLTTLAQQGHPVGPNRTTGLPPNTAIAGAAGRLKRLAGVLDPRSFEWNPIELLAAMADAEVDYAAFTFAYIHFAGAGLRFGPVPWAGNGGAVLGGTGLAVSAFSPRVDQARAFARFAGSMSVQSTLWSTGAAQPANEAAWRRRAQTNPAYAALTPVMQQAYTRPRFDGWPALQLEAGDAVNYWLRSPSSDPSKLCSRLRTLWQTSLADSA